MAVGVKVLDLFAGLRGWADPWAARGHETFTVDLDPAFDVDSHTDIFELRAADLPWRPDVILASPPCERFSVLQIGRNWTGPDDFPPHQPKTEEAKLALALVEATRRLIAECAPAFFVIENPRAKLRKLAVVADFDRVTVAYCQYGEPFQKPTDLWGGFPPSWHPRPMCKPKSGCHVSAPRGSKTGIQGPAVAELREPSTANKDAQRQHYGIPRGADSKGTATRATLAALRSKIPAALSLELCRAAERDLEAGYVGTVKGRLF